MHLEFEDVLGCLSHSDPNEPLKSAKKKKRKEEKPQVAFNKNNTTGIHMLLMALHVGCLFVSFIVLFCCFFLLMMILSEKNMNTKTANLKILYLG